MKKIAITATLIVLALHGFTQTNFKILQPAEMKKELAIIQATLNNIHPGTYRFNTRDDIAKDFSQLNKEVSMPMQEDRYDILLAQLAAKIKCGHTYLNYWNQDTTLTARLFSHTFFPFLFRVIEGHMIVTHNLSENPLVKPGDEITAINGTSVKLIIDSLLTVSSSDGNHGLARKIDNLNVVPLDIDASNFNLFDIYFPLFFKTNFNTPTYELSVSLTAKRTAKIAVSSLTRKERQYIYVQRFGEIPVHEQNWSVKYLNKNTACFRIGDFETWQWKKDYKKFLDSVFTQLNQSGIKNLIVDIRGNGGGADDARDEVMSYLTNKPFGCDDPMHRLYKFLAIPDTLSPYLRTWDKSFKQPKDPKAYTQRADGYYENIAESTKPCEPVLPKTNAFKGRIFLLTNANNSSTTFTMAKLFQQQKMGLIIGEATSGTKLGINGGQFFFLRLPYSKIEMDIPLIWGASSIPQPDEGVHPDILVKTTQADVRSGRDPQIEAVLKYAER